MSELFDVYCECADEACTTKLFVSLAEWEDAKSAPNRSIVAHGHPLAAGERVIAETDRYVLAEGGTPPV